MNLQAAGAEQKALGANALHVAGIALVADHAGTLFHESESILIVADLHLEKGSSFAARRVFLPPYDTAATLARLAERIAYYRPRTIVALGDSFHDRHAHLRVLEQDRVQLASMQRGRDWIWISGNHDPEAPEGLGGRAEVELRIGPLTLRHEPMHGASHGEIAGHLHPAARVVSRSGSVRRRCYVGDGQRVVMPAFGAYAGGLNIRDAAFAPLFASGTVTAHVLGRNAPWRVGFGSCAPD